MRPSPRVSTALALAAALAYGVGGWMVALHLAAGEHARASLPFAAHWLRDASLTLPLVLVAVWGGLAVAGRLAARLRLAPAAPAAAALAASLAAAGAAVASAAASPALDALFGVHQLARLPLGLRVARDGLLALPAGLLLAAATLAVLRAAPAAARSRRVAAVPPRRLARLATATLVAATLVSTLAGPGNLPAQAAPAAGGAPCPDSAPVKRFDVTAIDVDVPLNRFGDHDPAGKMYALTSRLDDVRAEERSQKVSTGLRGDAIQPLVIRANQGDCVEISYRNDASGGSFGLHVDGLAYDAEGSGIAVGRNSASSPARGEARTYRYYVPDDPVLEGAHYLHPGPGNRSAVSHGLFGALVVEPPGSVYLDPNAADQARELESGWEATIAPAGKKAFRESALLFHEIGKENEDIFTADGHKLPTVDPHSDAYRPGTRAINYRSEPFMNRLDKAPTEESHGYASYTFGDPATPIPRGYLGDPTKFRLIHAGSEMLHVYHLHGGGDRWRFNPVADKTYDYADTGLNKKPKTKLSPSSRLDSQSFGPGESYNLEMEGGAGGVQQAAGDFLWHCHIAEHYVGGMWSFWRVYNTRQADFAVLPDRAAPPGGVDSSKLLGRTMPDGTTLTRDNLDDWIRPQLPPQGVPLHDQDASVWNWTVDNTADPAGPVYLGEPEDNGPWPDLPGVVPGHPSLFPGDEVVGNRPKILFDPTNGRIAYPLLRPHIGKRPPFSPNGHSGAPWLGEKADTAATAGTVSPWAGRPDGICPSDSPLRHFNVVAIEKAIQVTRKGGTDPNGMIYVLAKDKQAVLAGTKPDEPLAIRANVGDCVAVTLTSEQTDEVAADGFAKVNMHIHHVQFDPQASDGVISGMQYEQSVRPYKLEDPKLVAAAAAGDTTLHLADVAKFRPGVSLGVGLGTEGIEVHQIAAVDADAGTVTLRTPLEGDHPAGEWAGFEFVQYRWYPDVELDNVFWHDHVDGIHTWGHGLVGQLIVEPPGSTYHDPRTGEEVESGTIVDVHTNQPLAEGLVNGSFREMALWQIDENPVTDSTINLRAEPFGDRSGDPSLRFSSYTHGDPYTPMPRAYPGDPVVIRAINVGPSVDTLHVDGHRFWLENRYAEAGGIASTAADTMNIGVSERFTVILRDGAGGSRHAPGDYLYMNGVGRRFRQGAWGILRVLPGRSDDLKPLPGTDPAAGPALPSPTGGRRPVADPGSPCPAGAPLHTFDVSAIRLPSSAGGDGRKLAYVPTRDAAAVKAGTRRAEPLVLHAAAGECVRVRLTNDKAVDRVSFHVGELVRDPASSGVNVGYSPEQTVAKGETRTYLYHADTDKVGSALISDLGGDDTAKDGLYGALVVAPAGASFTDPVSWQPTDVGAQVDVHVPGKPGYRDFTLAMADDDPQIGASFMPYPEDVKGPALVNYATAPRPDTPDAFSSAVHGDPATPILRAYAGDQVKVHALVTPGSEQVHTFNLGGLSWGLDAGIAHGNEVATRHIGPWAKVDAVISGGAGGRGRAPGDYFYGDLRRPFTEAGMWGLQRVLPRGTCPATPADGLACLGQPDLEAPTVTIDAKPAELGNDDSPQFGFSASEPASFECSTSTGADSFRPCTSPFRAGPLDDGTWTFKVRATDPAGNTGQAASHRFTVDTTAPSVTASPVGGAYPGPQQVTVTTSEPATVYWTDDGTTPTGGSRRYDGPLAVDASRTLKFLAVDEAGNGSAVATETYTIAPPADTTAPSVAAPDARPLAGSQLGAGAGTVKVRVAWSGSDAGSGVAGYELQQRTGTGEFRTVSSGPAATADRTLQVGTTYQFRTRATDAAGNQSGWRTGPAFRARLSQNNQQAVRYSAGWTWALPAGASGGSVRYATAAGATATFTFTGTSMAWVAPTGPQAGRAEVWVDGARAATVDLRTPTTRPRQLVFAAGWATTGVHTVQVKVLGTPGRPRVDVDGFVAMVRP